MPVGDTGDDASVVTEPEDPGFFPGDLDDDESEFARLEREAEEVAALQSQGQASSTAPPSATTPEGTSGQGAGNDPLNDLEFDPKYREDFDGLLYIGALTHSFRLYGHSFTIRTLTVDEILQVSLLVKQYEGSIGQNRAYLTGMAAACLELADSKPIYTPIGPNDDEVRGRFMYVKDHWYSWMVDGIYEQYLALEARVTEILSQMGEGSG